MSEEQLETYRRKRDPERTPEPFGGRGSEGSPTFVIQQHDASTMHWDLRLEGDGALKSWALPKGPSTDPEDKRLAVPTEDHPLDYADFEGVIPRDEYGGGGVIVWDRGTYRNLTADDSGEEIPLADAAAAGHIKVALDGEKLAGGYVLTRMGRGDQWLLIKLSDDHADRRRNPARTEPESVLSGQTVHEVGDGA
jgi:DNA ligase D-like protein (predicted 3'-phosphoesterase)